MDAEVIRLLILGNGEIRVALKRVAKQSFNLLGHALSAPIGHQKLEARVVPLQAITVVAEDLAHRLGHGPHLLGLEKHRQSLSQFRR